jgi:L-seryl-tRNA(Ser) seleniumtransferase
MSKRPSALSRRRFVGAAAATAAGLASLGTEAAPAAAQAGPPAPTGGVPNSAGSLEDNVYTRLLGVRPHLGAHEHISRLGGGRMPPEVLAAMAEANDYFVDMHELTLAAGKRAAELLGAEAALVTAGGFSGLILGAAACLTGSDPKKIEALPHPTWPRRECLIQTAQRFSYDRAYRAAGATIVYAETWGDMVQHAGEQTALIAGLSIAERQGVFAPPFNAARAPAPNPHLVKPEQLIALGKKARIPVLIDMASDLPPWDNLKRFLGAGADLVVLSGGKSIGGPQSTGLLLGRRDLIEAARLNATPFDNIGRGMKVGKEEVIGLIVALERYVKQDHGAEMEKWNDRARRIAAALQGIPGLTAVYAVNTAGFGDADLSWDETIIPLTRESLRDKLVEGKPRVELEVIISKEREAPIWHATARTRVLRDGEELLVAGRLREIFQDAAKKEG